MADWDLRELALLASWAPIGHDFRSFGEGIVLCRKCQTIVHVRKRAIAAAEGLQWGTEGSPLVVVGCRP